ncbi:hypothetical protein Q1695_002762 [Nippostrongylus brasiliensis]|nr:hypothetical protein Q1695_002762 [Nippostrongylus brasiliensis]
MRKELMPRLAAQVDKRSFVPEAKSAKENCSGSGLVGAGECAGRFNCLARTTTIQSRPHFWTFDRSFGRQRQTKGSNKDLDVMSLALNTVCFTSIVPKSVDSTAPMVVISPSRPPTQWVYGNGTVRSMPRRFVPHYLSSSSRKSRQQDRST